MIQEATQKLWVKLAAINEYRLVQNKSKTGVYMKMIQRVATLLTRSTDFQPCICTQSTQQK